MKEFRIRDLREDNDKSQIYIASKLGVAQQTYSQWETGQKFIPLKHLNNLCNYYNVTMDYVVRLSDNKVYSKESVKTILDKCEVGKNLKSIREIHNISVRGLAKELNTTHSTILSYESGKTLILTAFAFQICKTYEISLDWLCGRSPKKTIKKEKQHLR